MAWVELPGGVKLSTLIVGTLVCILTWFLILLLHGYQHRKNGFRVSQWFRDREGTLIVGLCVTIIIALMRGLTKDMAQLLTLMGFQPGPSAAISLGLAIAALLLGFKPSGKTEEEKTEQPKG
jgi:hypothetical protein